MLAALREGASNAEIAESLGVSVHTVKSHLSSMFAKLEVSDRTALARWEGQPGEALPTTPRRAPLWLAPLKIAGAAAGLLVLGLALWAALDGGRASDTSAEVAATQPLSTVTPAASPVATDEVRSIEGLFTEPRPIAPADEVRAAPPRPTSAFEWNREDVVLFDLEAHTTTDLGPGYVPSFSPDGRHLVWTAGAVTDFPKSVHVFDLAGGEERDLGEGQGGYWLDDETLVIRTYSRDQEQVLVDFTTGARVPATVPDVDPYTVEEGRWLLERTVEGEYPGWRHTFRLTDLRGEFRPLQFEAHVAELTSDGTLFIATPPEDAILPPDIGPHLEYGTTNIFAVEPETGRAIYLVSAVASAPNWSFDASSEYVAWMEGFCAAPDQSQVATRIFDRADRTILEIGEPWWVTLTSEGRLAHGAFGPDALFNLGTFEYEFVAPQDAYRVAWSPDYRYAAIGQQFGSGGPC